MASDSERKIIQQVEYYFGDCNLPRDRFLQEEIKKDDGWVPLETMLKFNRLKQLSDDEAVIAAAIKTSTANLIEVSEDNTKIRRNPEKPMPENTEERRQEIAARTVYAKEFPLDTTLDKIQDFLATFAEVEHVFLRKDAKKAFKGSIFATFKDLDGAKKFMEAETAEFNGKALEARKFKTDYFNEKQEERKKVEKTKNQKKEIIQERQVEEEEKKIKNQITKGAMLHLVGFTEGTSREDIKNMLQDYGAIAWVDYERGDTEAWVRYEKENQATEVLDKITEALSGDITLHGNKIIGEVLTGEEELSRWRKMLDDMQSRRRNKRHQGGGRGRGRGRDGRHGARWGKRPCKAKRDAEKAIKEKISTEGFSSIDNDGEPSAKKAKLE